LIINILKIAFIAALPITELRGAIPLALTIYKMPVFPAYFFAVLGNIVPVIFLLLYLKPFSDFLCRWHFLNIFFKWLFKRTHQYEEKIEKYGALFLLVFVAVPLPGTGAWTGSIAAFVFGIRFWYAFPAIVGGIIIAGIIVTLTSLGIISFI
jgi:uncharacterized membrane protein